LPGQLIEELVLATSFDVTLETLFVVDLKLHFFKLVPFRTDHYHIEWDDLFFTREKQAQSTMRKLT